MRGTHVISMPFLVSKKDKYGNEYLYIRHNHRVDGEVKLAYQVYLGAAKDLATRGKLLSLDFQTETIEFGLIAALLRIAKKIGLVGIINSATGKRDQGLSVGEHLLIAAINRCVEPVSKTHLMDWLDSTVLRKIYPDLDVNLDSRAYWTHFQYVTEDNVESIENELMRVIMGVYKIDYTHLSFDPTNFFTYINPRKPNQELPKHGHSKEGRATLNIINLSLFCTIDGGIPLFHLAYPGNTVDAIHFKSAIIALKARLKVLEMSPTSVVLTFDKGNLSPEGFDLIDEMELGYICSDRPSTHKDVLSIPPEEFTMHELPNGKQVGVKEFNAEKYGKERRFIAVYNPNEASWNLENLEKKITKKITEIKKYFSERVTFAPGERRRGQADKWRKMIEVKAKIKDMIGGEPYKSIITFVISGPEEIPVAEGGSLSVDLSINKTSKAETSLEHGKSFLMTNQVDLPAHEVVWVYRQQYLVEQAFKWLKGNEFLSVRPMYHHVDSSIRGHIFVCYLGLVLLSLLVREVVQHDIPMSIHDAVKTLKEIKMTRIILPGRTDAIENVNAMDPDAKQLYDLLEMGNLFKRT